MDDSGYGSAVPAILLLIVGVVTGYLRSRRDRGVTVSPPVPPESPPLSEESRERMRGWLAAWKSGELFPPSDVHDRSRWDVYWRKQIEHGVFEQGFNDMMASDPALVPTLVTRGARTVLCVGIGLSTEALALAQHGFVVTALDLSDVPRATFTAMVLNSENPQNRLSRLTWEADTLIIAAGDVVDPESRPKIHGTNDHQPRGGGSLRYVTGDLTDAQVCPGPFDAIIERRTVQLFPEAEQAAALDRLVARLAPSALFVSHEHRGNWKPGQSRQHYAQPWLERIGLPIAHDAQTTATAPRVAQLRLTSG